MNNIPLEHAIILWNDGLNGGKPAFAIRHIGHPDYKNYRYKIGACFAEGIVYKRKDASFDAGRSPNALKHKIQESSTFEVVKVNDQRSVAIALYDDNNALIPMGNVTVPANYPIPEIGALVEVEYMYRFEDGALMQPKYKGERSDVEGPVRLDQIKRIKPKSMTA